MLAVSLAFPHQLAAHLKVPEPPRVASGSLVRFAQLPILFVPPLPAPPDFSKDILVPLRTVQAEKAKRDALEAARRAEESQRLHDTVEATKTAQTASVQSTEVPSDIPAIIHHWAQVFGVNPAWMLKIAQCESSYNPNASNGNHFGIFQFLASTFAAYAPLAGAGPDYWEPNNNARTAAYMLAHGQSWQWSCA